MKIQRKAIEVMLSDGETLITVHAPSMTQFSQYLASFSVIMKIAEAFEKVTNASSGIVTDFSGLVIAPALLDSFYPLLAMLSDISIEDFKELPVADGTAIMFAYINLLAADRVKTPDPTPAETAPQTQDLEALQS